MKLGSGVVVGVTLNAEQSAGLGWYVCDSWGFSEVIKKRKKSEIS